MTRRSWTQIKRERIDDPEVRAGYDQAQLAFELGEQVRRLREARGMSQQELARRAGTSQPAIARLEAGGVDPRLETLHRLGRALDADLVLRFQPREAPATAR
ncbi:MAG: helix-turn-helix domain-containing protein [Dehalococcoidia bacterium]